jgi:hypothetical protein
VRTPQKVMPAVVIALNVTTNAFALAFHWRDNTPLQIVPDSTMSTRLFPRCAQVPLSAPDSVPSAFSRGASEFRIVTLMSLP